MTKTLYIFDQGLKGLVGHYYEYVRAIVEAAEAEGIRCVVCGHVDGGDGSFASFDLYSVFRDDVWGTIPGEDYHSAASMNGISARFMEDASKILAEHPIKPGDMIFLPNIAKPHVVAAALIAEKFAPMGVLTHFMFRYPAAHFEGETAAQSFRRLEAAAASHDVSLCTDSHRLAENLASLTHLSFVVFPIPHTWHKETEGEPARDPKRPLHCVSLGNARDEKGMAEILEAVRLSAQKPWGDQLRFSLQVNKPYQVEEQIEAFRQGPHDPRTTLIDRAMSSEEYAAVLDSADVVLVPYWRSIYQERTSGVFLEGVITGKLVLCTRDTWMSDLLELHNGGIAVDDRSGAAVCEGLRQLIERRDELQKGADRAARYWQGIHCPKNFVAHLTGQARRPVVCRQQGKKAAVLFPWGEAVSGKTGAATRLKYFVKYLESVYDEVRILFTGGGEPGGTIGKRSQAVPVHYSEKAKALHDQLRLLCRNLAIPEERCFHLWFHLWPLEDELFKLRCEEMILWADEVYLEYTFFSDLVDGLCRQHGKPYILTLHDIVSDQSIEAPFLHQATKALEFGGARKASRVVCSSEADRTRLASEGIVAELIPHPIDCQEAVEPFSREEARVILDDLYGLKLDGRRVCFFVGSFYPPNTEAAEKIAEMAERSLQDPKMRDVTFVVAGNCMQPRCTENFTALGMVEGAAIYAIMACSDMVLIPLQRGTGVSVKSIEALARGSLILSTSVGMRGLNVVDGVHCRIEDDLESYPACIAEMLSNADTAQRMRAAARKFGEQFDYRRLMALYLPGAEHKSRPAETREEFSVRRAAAIRELLPRLERTQQVSPLLRDLVNSIADEAFRKSAADPSARLEIDVPQSTQPNLKRGDVAGVADDAELLDEVDPEWYLAAYPDVAMLGMDPREHYAWIGRELGRKPKGRTKKKLSASASILHRRGRRWFLADPSLVDQGGHCMRYLLSLVEPLKERGEHAHLLGNRNLAPAVDELTTCEPAFSLRCEEQPFIPGIDAASTRGAEHISRRRSELFRADLDRIADRYAISSDDVLLMNSLRHWSLQDVIDWLEARPTGQAPRVIIVLHYTPFPSADVTDSAEEGYRQAFERIESSEIRHRILLCTDSERLAAEYRSLCDVDIHVLPIPHSPPPPCKVERGLQPIVLGFAGEARPSKGFHLLQGLVRRLRAATPPGALSFAFQCYGASDEVLPTFSLSDDVRTLSEPLGEEQYEAFVAEIDLMLIPYIDVSYRAQTSGVFSEAMALGIPTIVPEDTWMADQLAATGAGLTFRRGDEEDLARSCMQAIDSYAALHMRVTEAAAAWRAYHNAENFCETMIRLVERQSR